MKKMVLKSRLKSNKGYLQIDIMVAMMSFFFIFFIVFSYYTSHSSKLVDGYEINFLKSNAKDLCSILTFTSGYPHDWEDNNSSFDYIGFKNYSSDGLDFNKINAINDSFYFLIKDNMISDDYYFSFSVSGILTGQKYVSLGPSPDSYSYYYSWNCYSYYLGEPTVVFVEVWK